MLMLKSSLATLTSRVAARTPVWVTTLPLMALLDAAQRLNWLSPPAELEGRRFAITVTDLQLRAQFACRGGRFTPFLAGEPELELAAAAVDFLSLARGTADADTLFFQRRLKIAGDTELGLIVKNWMDAVERPSILSHALFVKGADHGP